jgi:hypothetical protein
MFSGSLLNRCPGGGGPFQLGGGPRYSPVAKLRHCGMAPVALRITPPPSILVAIW